MYREDEPVRRPQEHWRRPEIAQAYDRFRFDGLKGRLYRWREERALERALSELHPGSSVLDVACGTGRITALLACNGFATTGCDISPAMLAVARRRLICLGRDVPFVEGRVEQLPYRNDTFDAVACIGLLMHLDADARIRALRELARVSRGPLVLQYGCLDGLWHPGIVAFRRPPGHVRFPVSMADMRLDFARAHVIERVTLRVLPGVSSSVVVLVSKTAA